MDESKKFMSAKQLAVYLGVSNKYIYDLHKRGIISSLPVGDRLIRFDPEKVIEELKQYNRRKSF